MADLSCHRASNPSPSGLKPDTKFSSENTSEEKGEKIIKDSRNNYDLKNYVDLTFTTQINPTKSEVKENGETSVLDSVENQDEEKNKPPAMTSYECFKYKILNSGSELETFQYRDHQQPSTSHKRTFSSVHNISVLDTDISNVRDCASHSRFPLMTENRNNSYEEIFFSDQDSDESSECEEELSGKMQVHGDKNKDSECNIQNFNKKQSPTKADFGEERTGPKYNHFKYKLPPSFLRNWEKVKKFTRRGKSPKSKELDDNIKSILKKDPKNSKPIKKPRKVRFNSKIDTFIFVPEDCIESESATENENQPKGSQEINNEDSVEKQSNIGAELETKSQKPSFLQRLNKIRFNPKSKIKKTRKTDAVEKKSHACAETETKSTKEPKDVKEDSIIVKDSQFGTYLEKEPPYSQMASNEVIKKNSPMDTDVQNVSQPMQTVNTEEKSQTDTDEFQVNEEDLHREICAEIESRWLVSQKPIEEAVVKLSSYGAQMDIQSQNTSLLRRITRFKLRPMSLMRRKARKEKRTSPQ